MTCRVARLYQSHHPEGAPVSCCECGATHLEEFVASQILGPQLCALCAVSKIECGALMEGQARSTIREQLVA